MAMIFTMVKKKKFFEFKASKRDLQYEKRTKFKGTGAVVSKQRLYSPGASECKHWKSESFLDL